MPSSEVAVGVRALSKTFGTARALDSIDLTVEPGTVHGLVGPNGAGKTTLMRLLFGLIAADSGTVEVFGRRPDPSHPEALRDVGGFIERPTAYPYLTGRQNLELLARLDDLTTAPIIETLERTGLTGHEDRKFSGYSLGLRQRFGIAASLLRAPRLLVLDEPSNGLDPRGILEIHALVRELAAGGTTVLLSSHSMSEVADLCDAATVIDRGRVVADASIAELQARAPRPTHALVTSDDAKALTMLRRRAKLDVDDAAGLQVSGEEAALDAAVVALGKAGVAVRSMTQVRDPLTSLYLELTSAAERDA